MKYNVQKIILRHPEMHKWIDDGWSGYRTIHNEKSYYLLLDKFTLNSECTEIKKVKNLSTEVVHIT